LKKTHLAFIVIGIILALGFLVRASMNNRKLDARFRDEMAQRFDFERKVLSLGKERSGLYARIKSLNQQLVVGQQTIGELQSSRETLLKENKKLQSELMQLRDAIGAPTAAVASGAM